MSSAVTVNLAFRDNINRRNFVKLDIHRVNFEIIQGVSAAKDGFADLRCGILFSLFHMQYCRICETKNQFVKAGK